MMFLKNIAVLSLLAGTAAAAYQSRPNRPNPGGGASLSSLGGTCWSGITWFAGQVANFISPDPPTDDRPHTRRRKSQRPQTDFTCSNYEGGCGKRKPVLSQTSVAPNRVRQTRTRRSATAIKHVATRVPQAAAAEVSVRAAYASGSCRVHSLSGRCCPLWKVREGIISFQDAEPLAKVPFSYRGPAPDGAWTLGEYHTVLQFGRDAGSATYKMYEDGRHPLSTQGEFNEHLISYAKYEILSPRGRDRRLVGYGVVFFYALAQHRYM